MTEPLEIRPVCGLPEFGPGVDLAGLICHATEIQDGDVLIVSQKVVSKSEGAVERVLDGETPEDARHRIAHAEASRIVLDEPVLITETPHGFVCANGGVDASNAAPGELLLLPQDPDRTARQLRDEIAARTNKAVGVVISDTFGRPWRVGQTDVAIGLASIPALRDERGETDRAGKRLEVTESAVADALAASADLVRRKADGVPVAIIRGFSWSPDSHAAATDLVRTSADDLFPRGRGMLARSLASSTTEAAKTGANVAATGRAPLTEQQLKTLRAVASQGGATLILLESSAGPFLVQGDRLAAGLVISALLDEGRAPAWRDTEGGVLVELGSPGTSQPPSSPPRTADRPVLAERPMIP